MRWTGITLALGMALLITTNAQAQAHSKPKHRTKHVVHHRTRHSSKRVAVAKHVSRWSGAENGLLGIKLYDTGMRVLQVYGTPDQILALNTGLTNSAPAGGGAPGMGAPGMGGPGGPGGPGMGGRRGPNAGMSGGQGSGKNQDAAGRFDPDFDFGDTTELQQGGVPMGPNGSGPGQMPPGVPGGRGRGGRPGGGPSFGGAGGPGAGMGGPPAMGGGVPGVNGGAGERVTFTRWVYNRSGSKYAFIIDKDGRVVQIEAIGLDNGAVRTKRGIGFGSTFYNIMSAYNSPDGYEISGDNLMMRYLVHQNVAFRLSRLGTKKPQVVTGIVVAAGKA